MSDDFNRAPIDRPKPHLNRLLIGNQRLPPMTFLLPIDILTQISHPILTHRQSTITTLPFEQETRPWCPPNFHSSSNSDIRSFTEPNLTFPDRYSSRTAATSSTNSCRLVCPICYRKTSNSTNRSSTGN
jgi:hypothetical protein